MRAVSPWVWALGLVLLIGLFILLRSVRTTTSTRSIGPAAGDTGRTAGTWFASANQPPAPATELRGIVTATRFWGSAAGDLVRLDAFITRALRYSELVLVAVRTELDTTDAAAHIRKRWPQRVRAISVTPWGEVTPALNAMLFVAAQQKYESILYQSVEVAVEPAHVRALQHELDADTLVAGGALPGHTFRPGAHPMTGLTMPWNTLSLWHVPSLVRTGFLMVSDGVGLTDAAGNGVGKWIEEVATASALQSLAAHAHAETTVTHLSRAPTRFAHSHSAAAAEAVGADDAPAPAPAVAVAPLRTRAKLVALPDEAKWLTADAEANDAARAQRHKWKMQTKNDRARQQLAALGIAPGTVWHVRPGADGADGSAAHPTQARQRAAEAAAAADARPSAVAVHGKAAHDHGHDHGHAHAHEPAAPAAPPSSSHVSVPRNTHWQAGGAAPRRPRNPAAAH